MRGNAPAMRPGSVAPVPAGFKAVMPVREPTAEEDVDFFPTRPWGARAGAEIIRQLDRQARTVWEPACGAGHMAHGLRDYFRTVHQSDICRYTDNRVFDFVSAGPAPFDADWIVTNPPFDLVEEFIEIGWDRARRGVAVLLRGACLEGQERHGLLHERCPLTAVAPFSERLPMHRGFWDPERTTATFYAWFFFCKPGVGPRLPLILGKRRPFIIDIPPGAEARLTRPDDAARFAATTPSLEGANAP